MYLLEADDLECIVVNQAVTGRRGNDVSITSLPQTKACPALSSNLLQMGP